jgi:hypothetical protein
VLYAFSATLGEDVGLVSFGTCLISALSYIHGRRPHL